MPPFMQEILTNITFLARQSPEVSRHSGVSVRMSISNTECMLSAAEKRAIMLGEKEAAPRITDLPSIVSLTAGKLELETFSRDGQEEKLIGGLIDEAVKQTFDKRFEAESLADVVEAFHDGASATVSDSAGSAECAKDFSEIPALASAVNSLCPGCGPAEFASAAEFILEGLYLHRKIQKEELAGRAKYRG
jgi:magnesium chelatase subunit I